MNSHNESPTVVVIDDDAAVAGTVSSIIGRAGFNVETFVSAAEARERLRSGGIDVVVSDVMMPDINGLDLLEQLRRSGVYVPVILMTGSPKLDDTMRAMELGAFRYIAKPFDRVTVIQAVEEAVKWGRLIRVTLTHTTEVSRQTLEAALDRALDGLCMHYQPIVGAANGKVFGYEALMRSNEPTLRSPPAVIDAAQKLGRLHTLGRLVRRLVAEQISASRPESVIFVNLHSADLADPQLYSPDAPLSKHASGVVLELTERESLEAIDNVDKRLAQLRALGFRIAVDDLGAGYAGLSYFSRVQPDVVKIDMSLTRNVHSDPVKRRVVSSICELAKDLSMIIVAEGIETTDEFNEVARNGVDLVQGYLFGKPAPFAQSAMAPELALRTTQ
ncbi:MAG: EAL domain-containing protein [Myxococcales bacterium]|nr:EAL domain-containing protein [Myxococcales bacterium]